MTLFKFTAADENRCGPYFVPLTSRFIAEFRWCTIFVKPFELFITDFPLLMPP